MPEITPNAPRYTPNSQQPIDSNVSKGNQAQGSQKPRSSISAKEVLQSAKNTALNPIAARHIKEKRHVGHADQVILNHSTAKELGVPPVVHLRNNGGVSSGFVVHPRLVVTARHCVLNDSPFEIYFFEKAGIEVPEALKKDQSLKSKKWDWQKPSKVHIFGSNGQRHTFDFKKFQEADKKEKKSMQDAFKKALNVSALQETLSTASMPPIINQVPDVAVLEFDGDIQHIDKTTIPSLLDEEGISLAQSSKVSKRLLGFPGNKLEEHFNHLQTLKDQKSDALEELPLCPLFASEAPKNVDFSPNFAQRITAKVTGKKNIYAKSFRGIASYGGNSGGPLVSSLNGKLYYTGVLNGSHPLGFDTTVTPMKGRVMSDLILPTLHEVQERNEEPLSKLHSLADIGVNPKKIEAQQSFMDWIKALILKHLPERAQDQIFMWRLERAIAKDDIHSIHKVFESIGLTDPKEWLDLKDADGTTFDTKLKDYWKAMKKEEDSIETIESPS